MTEVETQVFLGNQISEVLRKGETSFRRIYFLCCDSGRTILNISKLRVKSSCMSGQFGL